MSAVTGPRTLAAERAEALRAGASLLSLLLTSPDATPESQLDELEAAGVGPAELAVAGLDRAHLEAAVAAGCSAREIARLAGVPVTLVERVLDRIGLDVPAPTAIDGLDVRCALRDEPDDPEAAAALLANRVGVLLPAARVAVAAAPRGTPVALATASPPEPGDASRDDADLGCPACAPATGPAVAPPAAPRPLWQEVGLGFLSVFRGLPQTMAFAVVVAAILKTFALQVFVVPTPSMSPALLPGDRMVVEKFSYRLDPPQRGDIVVFEGGEVPSDDPAWRDGMQWLGLLPADGTDYVKRVIGLPGETVTVRDGRVTVDGTALPDSFAVRDRSNHGPVVVPEGHLFVLGDNRPGSVDSRSPEIGPVAIDDVIGRATFTVLPRDRWGRLNTWGLESVTSPTDGAATTAAMP